MRLTINSTELKNIYTGITTVYYAHLENEELFPHNEVRNVKLLKDNIASLLDVDGLFFKQKKTLFNSPFIISYSKEARDILNIDFSVSGLLIIKKCLEIRLQVLHNFYDDTENDDAIMQEEIEDAIEITEDVLDSLEVHMIPMYN